MQQGRDLDPLKAARGWVAASAGLCDNPFRALLEDHKALFARHQMSIGVLLAK